ncbi:MAG: hypothetical protein J2P21_00540 [Chloracidobacterium sp.]|nr:hypothetical protein [Chloracidobacterium sp.]
MSMEHKAFVLDYESFADQLSDILKTALETDNDDDLAHFIEANISSLKDPYDGDLLDLSWQELVETEDAHSYGDFALTKFYDPASDIGLGHNREAVENLLNDASSGLGAAILGSPFGPANNYFDPGKMGSYFQTPNEVQKNLSLLENLVQRRPELSAGLSEAIEMLQQASEVGRGLYVTF